MLTASQQLCFKIYLIELEAFFDVIFVKKFFAKCFNVGYYMTCDIQNCLFLVNICFVAPSQFALYMHNTKMYRQGILVSVQPNFIIQ